VTKENLLYARGGAFFYGRDQFRTNLIVFSMKDRKENTLAENIQAITVSDDARKCWYGTAKVTSCMT